MPPKKGIFRAIRITTKSGRGGENSLATWNQFMSQESKQYESIMAQYNSATTTQEDKDAAIGYPNECAYGFGNDFYHSRQLAGSAWNDLDEAERDKVAAFIKEYMIHPESAE